MKKKNIENYLKEWLLSETKRLSKQIEAQDTYIEWLQNSIMSASNDYQRKQREIDGLKVQIKELKLNNEKARVKHSAETQSLTKEIKALEREIRRLNDDKSK